MAEPEDGLAGQLDPAVEASLLAAAAVVGTPCYVYSPAGIVARIERLRRYFAGRVAVGYAVKANPNPALLRRLEPHLDRVDVSSAGEIERALAAGFPPHAVGFTGPAKRAEEIERAAASGCTVVCENRSDVDRVAVAARDHGAPAAVLLRINPAVIPDVYDLPMAARPSQFGFDEEDVDEVLGELGRLRSIRFRGFHVYAGSNARDARGVAASIIACLELYERLAARHCLRPQTLIIGPGFGIGYHPGERELDVAEVARQSLPAIERHRSEGALAGAEVVLELGRWLVGPEGWLVTRVINRKHSRGVEIRMLDAGFHTHLAAAGMLGSVLRRPWRMHVLGPPGVGPATPVMLTGPLCTVLDTLAARIELPALDVGSLLAVASSGAYGATASPVRFIDHPAPREVLIVDGEPVDVSYDQGGACGGSP